MKENLLKNLNELQKKVVLHKEGPLLVLAGAGTGKTRAISHRVAYLVSEGVAPESILAITFTNKAAGEMRERINNLLSDVRCQLSENDTKNISNKLTKPRNNNAKKSPFVSTFHALGVHVLKRGGEELGIPRSFTILDKSDGLSIIKTAMKELDIDPKQFQPQKMLSVISKRKADLMEVDDYIAGAGSDFFPQTVGMIWGKYEEALKKQNALDFDDLISKTIKLFQKGGKTAEYYQNLWKYVLVDEYQDTNKSQYKLSRLLAKNHSNICAIGDIDQSIYGFRGADFRNITNFERDYPDHVMVALEENYRSTQNILEAAKNVIEKNKIRKSKKLISQKDKGAEISLFEARDEEDEADFVISKIKELIKGGEKPSDIAILFRANFQSRILEEFCIKKQVPYQMLGTRFYERKEVKDILSFIRVALNRDDMVSLKRIINVPPRGIGKVVLDKFFAGGDLSSTEQKKIDAFKEIIEEIREAVRDENTSRLIRFVMRKSGYMDSLEKDKLGNEDRIENLKELVTIATRYDEFGVEGISKLMEDAVLMSDQDNLDKKKEAVRLMTVHSAKGLEFDNVFVVGMEEGLFPHSMTKMESPEKQEEERRLFYVAITRAREKLFLTFSSMRMIYGSRQLNVPSSFLSDIPEHLFKFENHTGREKVIEYL